MDNFAMAVGYLFIAFSGVVGMIGFFWLTGEMIYRATKRGMNWCDLEDAIIQWRKNNPEKAKRFEKRNGA